MISCSSSCLAHMFHFFKTPPNQSEMIFKHWPICFKHFKSLKRACPKFRSGLPVQSAVKHKITHDGFNCGCIAWLTARVLDNHVCIATHNSSCKLHRSEERRVGKECR